MRMESVRAFAIVASATGISCFLPRAASAGTTDDTKDEKQQPARPAPRKDHARVDLGTSFPNLGSVGAGGVAGATSLGALAWVPAVEAAFELHLSGPAWLFARASGSYHEDAMDDYKAQTWMAAGDLGLRLEAPIFRWLEAGGHALVGLGTSGSRVIGAGAFDSMQNSWLRGVAGVGAHLRPTDFFGVRLSLDLLSAGYATYQMPQQNDDSIFVALTAVPRANAVLGGMHRRAAGSFRRA